MSEKQHTLYRKASEQFAAPIARLARTMERDPDRARDLEQEIQLELWRSLARFDERCALKTWVFRVAHNVAADHVARHARQAPAIPLDEVAELATPEQNNLSVAERLALARSRELIRRLPRLEAQVILLWLEGYSGREIAEITRLSSAAVATRVHRIKAKIAAHFVEPEKEKSR